MDLYKVKAKLGKIQVAAGVPQGLFLGPLLFLIYISDFLNGLQSNAKLFADDTLFSTIQDRHKHC